MASTLKVNEIQHTGGTTALTIDSSGRILQPTKPAFRAHLTSLTTFTSGSVIIYNQKNFDIGTDYNATTGKFTAPVTGVYLVLWNGLLDASSSAGDKSVRFKVNNVEIPCSTYETKVSGQAYTQMSNNALIQLSANDVFHVSVGNGQVILFGNTAGNGDNQSHISICLIG